MSEIARRLTQAGMSEVAAENKAALFDLAARALGGGGEKRWFVPGRIEVMGKHTDYAGGPSLVCAAERGICLVTRPRQDRLVRVRDVKRGFSAEFSLSPNISVPNGWANYVGTVVRRMARNFPGAARGVDIAFASDLPSSAGLSSSSALIVAMFTALADANRLTEQPAFAEFAAAPEKLAAYLACVENGQSYGNLAGGRGVGTFGGSEDHTAILCSYAGQLDQYRFCPVRLEQRVAIPSDWVLVIGSSGVEASKTGAARELYNRASLMAKAVLDTWNASSRRNDCSLDAAVGHAPDAAHQIRGALQNAELREFSAEELVRRFEHYLLESRELVPAATSAFASADAAALGGIVDRSQCAAEELLGNQVAETIALARSARELGAIAASAFGAGFGGSVWAVVRSNHAADFLAAWHAHYASQFPDRAQRAEFFLTGAGPGLTAL